MTDLSRAQKLFLILSAVFVANAILAEFIGVKIFALEPTLGIDDVHWSLFGQNGTLNFTAGVLLWPVVFVMTDIINEFYGKKGARFVTLVAMMMVIYAFIILQLAIRAPISAAFLCAQLIDVAVFHRIRDWTGERWLGLRATGSTLVSQFFDSFIVLYIAFVLGPQHWPVSLFLAVGTVNYLYKSSFALAATPVLYGIHKLIDGWLGHDVAEAMKRRAAEP